MNEDFRTELERHLADPKPEARLSNRRDVLRGAGVAAAGGLAYGALAGTASAAPKGSPAGGAQTLFPAAAASVLQGMCTFTPEAIEGPFYLDLGQIKQDITDGKPGFTTYVALQVLNADDCTPLQGVAVDLWHTDALGVYSGFGAGAGETFLRGTQISGADGVVVFKTIFPGWYPGRCCHYHVKVHPTASTEFTTQLYYPQNVVDAVYTSLSPYDQQGLANTTNDQDGFFTPETVQAWGFSGGLFWSGLILGVS